MLSDEALLPLILTYDIWNINSFILSVCACVCACVCVCDAVGKIKIVLSPDCVTLAPAISYRAQVVGVYHFCFCPSKHQNLYSMFGKCPPLDALPELTVGVLVTVTPSLARHLVHVYSITSPRAACFFPWRLIYKP